ncbi:MAG: chemotaxis protein CheW [Spirochaetaceae bacterium]|jgi:purine-binding chemotaxis protein CheW|nr:chemotaxis protein CheW [Spirochaetaceae bacterium]
MAANDTPLQLVTFNLADELYGVNIMDVKEIVNIMDVRPIPNAPHYIEGILNLRGEIIPIINLHKRFNLKEAGESGAEGSPERGFVILNIEGSKIGIIIDKIARVVMIDRKEIQRPPQMLSGIGTEYILGVARLESLYLVILDTKKIFDPKELQKIKEIT